MYTTAVRRNFIAQHYLVGGDWGRENEHHSHHYQIELQLQGETLSQYGFLTDIVDIETALSALIDHYRDCTLNELPEFIGLNPSLENFSRILCQALSKNLHDANISTFTVRLWENDLAWAAYQIEK
jgi:6-pyruvoyltetrahydropterin/6-carboxytetrahydropterin synthase